MMALARMERNQEGLDPMKCSWCQAPCQAKEIDAKALAGAAAADIEISKIGDEWRKRKAADEASKAKRFRRMNASYFGP